MALIPPAYLDTVVAVGFPMPHGTTRWAASGFLYGEFYSQVDAATAKYKTYLVTNRHVLADEKTLVLRFNPEADEPAREFRADLFNPGGRQIWAPHPDPAIDIAVLPVGVDFLRSQGVRVSFLESDHHVLFREQAASRGLTEGDGVFALGFPMGNVGARRSFVIVRQGAIARIRDWLAGAANEFLIDASIFPGNSGGPVLNRPEVSSITGTQSVNASYLIGVVSGFISYTDVAVSAQTGRPRVTFEENTALASVVPADYIREAIAAFRAANPEAPASPPGTVTEEPPPNGNAETPPAGE